MKSVDSKDWTNDMQGNKMIYAKIFR